ncbi:MAG: hydroxylamine reductase [Kiritimatiellia bacterium]
MFCFQCEQTAKGTGCTIGGVCGKTAEIAASQDALTAALIRFAQHVPEAQAILAMELIERALFTTITNVSFDTDPTFVLIQQLREAAGCDGSHCPAEPLTMDALWNAPEDIRSLKSTILFGLRGMAAYAHHARILGLSDPTVETFFLKALRALGEEKTLEELLALTLELGHVNLTCMATLDKANTTTYGSPEPTKVGMLIEPGPFIVITGHDLHDLADLLPQATARGVAVYTHGEMLPAHGYPELKKYAALKGNFGTAWQNQQKEFDAIPGALLFTTNCLMPPRPSYADRVFTTDVVRFPHTVHIEADAQGHKDFTAAIDKAVALGGYPAAHQGCGINGGTQLLTGFGHAAVLAHAPELLNAITSGTIKQLYLVGGCDGAKPGRNAYTEFVKQTPADSLVLTLACGKYRFNDLDLGMIGPFPRLLDMGQCNDAYSAIVVADALSKACKCGINELPLTLVLSWYEQKAVCILLTLLALGINNINLGPTFPAFLSPAVRTILAETFGIKLFVS